jgi:drug/metabolite transporter (DMT)-like permease
MKHSYLRLHASILLAGATGLFGKIITISELPLVFYRVLFSALLLTLIMGFQHRLHRLPWRQGAAMMSCGVLLAAHWVCYYGSIKMANVSIGAVCFALVGFFTAIIEPIVGRHRPSWRELLLSLLTVCGIILIFGFDARYRLGIAVGCLSSLLYSLFSVLSKRVQTSVGRGSSTMLLCELTGGGMVLAVGTLAYAYGAPDATVLPSQHDLLALIAFASVFTIAPFLLLLQALRSISAFTVNLSYNLEPIYTISLAMMLFGEAGELTGAFWGGITLILLSVAVQTIMAIRTKRT